MNNAAILRGDEEVMTRMNGLRNGDREAAEAIYHRSGKEICEGSYGFTVSPFGYV